MISEYLCWLVWPWQSCPWRSHFTIHWRTSSFKHWRTAIRSITIWCRVWICPSQLKWYPFRLSFIPSLIWLLIKELNSQRLVVQVLGFFRSNLFWGNFFSSFLNSIMSCINHQLNSMKILWKYTKRTRHNIATFGPAHLGFFLEWMQTLVQIRKCFTLVYIVLREREILRTQHTWWYYENLV